MLETVRDMYIHLLVKPFVIAAYAACGWVTAITASLSTSAHHCPTFSDTYLYPLAVPLNAHASIVQILLYHGGAVCG